MGAQSGDFWRPPISLLHEPAKPGIVTPLDAVLGLLALVLAIAGLSLIGLFVHLMARPRSMPTLRVTDALKRFEPRGGRQRFNVRLFETGAVAAVWVVASGVLALFLGAGDLGSRARLFAGVFASALVVGTWWAHRRGVFRGHSQRPDPRHSLRPRRRRRA